MSFVPSIPTDEEVLSKIEELRSTASATIKMMSDHPLVDQRWTSIAKTDLQRALMSLERAFEKPDHF